MAIPLIQNVEKQDINTSIIAIRRQLEQLYNALGVTESTVSSEDISKSTGTPLGTWASFENDYAPNIEWLQGGTTFNPNTYPALAMYLGGNTVPERFDHNRLGDAELITVEYLDASTSTLSNVTPTSFTTIAYDGEIEVNARFIGNQGLMGAYLNDKYIAFINIYGGGSGSPEYKTIALSVKKGDRLCLVFNRRYTSSTANTWLGSPYVQARYYKHPMFIKATPTSADSDYEGTLNAIREFYVRNNTYSTEERLTGGVWIDGKPIYRKVISINNEYFDAGSTYKDFPSALNGNEACITTLFICGFRNRSYIQPAIENVCGYALDNLTTLRVTGWSLAIYINQIVLEYTKSTDS